MDNLKFEIKDWKFGWERLEILIKKNWKSGEKLKLGKMWKSGKSWKFEKKMEVQKNFGNFEKFWKL